MSISKIKCLVVDDEPLAADVIATFIGQLDNLTMLGKCDNAIAAMLFLQQHKVDLLFLDIRMPKLSGLDFLKTLSNRPAVILTTAYRDYAVDGFELNVLDYLLKPVSFERFLVAVNKYLALRDTVTVHHGFLPLLHGVSAESFIYLKADKKMIKVLLKDIICIESLNDYVKVKTVSQDIITYQRITYLEEKLPDEQFLRIHRSYIIAIDKIKSFSASQIEVGGLELPIGRQYKAEVMKALGHTER